jgi:hypothetical protein
MRIRLLALTIALGGVVLASSDATAVPSFTRQTGLTCNQCHVSHTPVPSFTFTGRKFRLNGYRTPVVGQKIEAGEEGAVSGRRLSIPLIPMLSFRFGSNLLSQSKAPGATEASPMETRVHTNQALFFTGSIGDHFGLWMETYFINGSARGSSFASVSAEEFDLKFVNVTDRNVLGLAVTNQGVRELAGFGPWPIRLTDYTNYGTSGSYHPGLGGLFLYGLFNDRFLAAVGASPGADNPRWDRFNWQGLVGYAFKNSDENELWLNFIWSLGQDAIPLASAPVANTNNTVTFRDVARGITEVRTAGAGRPMASYLASDMGDNVRLNSQLWYSFIDRGPHSAALVLNASYNKDVYADNAEITHNGVGIGAQYFWDRTIGFNVFMDKPIDYEYTSPAGRVYPISPNDINVNAYLTYRLAMNMALNLSASNSKSLTLEGGPFAVPKNGYSWGLGLDILF